MLNDGRISRIIPPVYYHEENDLIRFVDALDAEVKILEKNIAGITDLINVDKCPDDKLAYLAALTNCPLIGDDPALWRKQIKNWPYILKMKGTELSLDLFLNSINVDNHKILTFFRDAEGNLVEEKPEGEPFKKDDGLWYNIRTHYFDIEIIYDKYHDLTNPTWYSDFLSNINIWLTRGKPFHAELRNLKIYIDRETDQNFYVGAALQRGIQHDIGLVYNLESDCGFPIVSAGAVVQGVSYSIGMIENDYSSATLEINSGGVISTGAEFNINMVA